MLTLTTLLALTLPLHAGDDLPDWGGFRGNNGSGTADAKIPDALDPEANLLWSTPVPAGYSSPVVTGSQVIVTGAEGKKLVTMSLEKTTGEVQWRSEVEFSGKRVGQNSPAASTPVTDGEHIFALFHHVGMIAYDLEGKEVWRNDLDAPFDIPHGLATSPVLHGNHIVVQIDEDGGARLVAIDKRTGENVWTVERPGTTHGYATPIIHQPAEGPAEVIVSGSIQIAAYSLEDGEKLWWIEGSAWQTKCVPVMYGDICIISAYMVPSSEFGAPPTPGTWEEVLAERDLDGDELISMDEWDHPLLKQAWSIFDLDDDKKLDAKDYAYLQSSGSAVGGLFAVRVGGRGDVSESHVVWKYGDRRGISDVVSPVLDGDTLYLLKDGGVLTAVDAKTGEKAKAGRVGEADGYYASPVSAGGRLVTASKGGLLSVVQGGAEWEVVSTTDLAEDVWSTPALVGELVVVRSQNALYCFFAE